MATQLTEMLAQFGQFDNIAQQLNASPADVTQGADAMLPAILGGFKNLFQNQSSAGGLASMAAGLLGSAGGLKGLLGGQSNETEQGNQILSKIFGSADVSRLVAQTAANKTGLDLSFLLKLLPLLTSLVGKVATGQAGDNQKGGAAAGLVSGLLGNVMGGQQQAATGGGLETLLKLAGNGNALNEILNLAQQPKS